MAFDSVFHAPEDNPTPELAVDTLVHAIAKLDGPRRSLGESDLNVRALDEFFDQSLDQFGVEFLASLAAHRDADIDQLGLYDAVRPQGRLWDRRSAFNQLDVVDACFLNVDTELLAWHRAPSYLNPDTSDELRDRVRRFGVPEWALEPDAPNAPKSVIFSALHSEALFNRQYGPQLTEIRGLSPFLLNEGRELDLARQLSDFDDTLTTAIKRWHQVAEAYGEDVGRLRHLDQQSANNWVDIVLLDFALTFEMRGERPEPLKVFVSKSPSDAEVTLWNALDRVVTHGRSTFNAHAEWSDRFPEMRSRAGELQISPLDMRLLGLPRAAEIIGADQDFDEPYKVSRAEFGRMCVLVSRFQAAIENVAVKSPVGSHARLTREELVAANNVLGMLEAARPPIYATASRRHGSYLVGRLRAELEVR